ncbi:TraR/DksA C4-type zinc finger protein [Vibrio bivalvicida]|uniref:TraR/DksA C4-type zinc finger protein n=1 Tax=Vibrio bivalvicida TaxID=1276888 RepID=A0ABV4MLG1_9VIBR
MTDQFDRAQAREQSDREDAIAHQLSQAARCRLEQPAEDEDGNRHCLSCGVLIPPKRIKAMPRATRCVSCQSRKEP